MVSNTGRARIVATTWQDHADAPPLRAPYAVVFNPHLSARAARLYLVLQHYTTPPATGQVSHEQLAADMGFRERKSIQRYLKELKDAGLVKWERGTDADGRHIENSYRITIPQGRMQLNV